MQPLKGVSGEGTARRPKLIWGAGALPKSSVPPPQSNGSTSTTSWMEWRERSRPSNYLNLGNYDPLCGVCGIVVERPGGVN